MNLRAPVNPEYLEGYVIHEIGSCNSLSLILEQRRGHSHKARRLFFPFKVRADPYAPRPRALLEAAPHLTHARPRVLHRFLQSQDPAAHITRRTRFSPPRWNGSWLLERWRA